MALTGRQQQIKDEFIAVRGTWSTAWEKILELSPHQERLKAAYIAFDAAATHPYVPGLKSSQGT